MKYAIVIFTLAISFCFGLRNLEYCHLIEPVQLDLEGEPIIGEKEVNYVIIAMDCNKFTRYWFRGSSKVGDNTDYTALIKKEMQEKYPEELPKCEFRMFAGGKMHREGKNIYVNGNTSKYGPSNAKFAAFKLKYRPEYKEYKFITE